MRRICILLFIFSFTIIAFAQQKVNPTIGKKEFEISLFYFNEYGGIAIDKGNHVTGTQIVHRWSWKNHTKIGIGGLAAVQSYDPALESDVAVYGALFGDIIQFIGKRQKWSVGGQIGHGIFKREREFEISNYKSVNRYTAGMYYSISFGYRSSISKKTLIIISPIYTFRNFRRKLTGETYSPPSFSEYTEIVKYSSLGLKLGIVF